MSQVLPESEIRDLVARAQAGCTRSRNRVVTANLKMVQRMAFQESKRCKSLTAEDLVSEGSLGLMHAVELFDPNRGVKFLTYAVHWIRAYITRAVVNTDELVRVPSNTLIQGRKAQTYRRKTLAQTGRAPTLEEYAEDLGVSLSRARDVLDAASRSSVSLSQPVSESAFAPPRQDLLPSHDESAHDVLQRKEDIEVARELMNVLTDREIYVLRCRLSDDPDTLEAVGHVLGLTKERVRQIQVQATDRARDEADDLGYLDDVDDVVEEAGDE